MRLVSCALVFLLASVSAMARPAPESFADLAASVLPVVVNVSTTQKVESPQADNLEQLFRDFLDRQQGQNNDEGEGPAPRTRKMTSLGSGFIIDPDGYIVTNVHVIENAEEITVTTHDNKELKARLVGKDEKTDLALLKVDTKEKLPAAKWGDADHLRVGDWVLAIGNPFGLGGTVTAGIVSARSRDIQVGQYDDFIQTDASINRGNSGGPMFNTDGEVVGINTIIFSPSGGSIGIGFAISSTLARPVIEQLKERGSVRRALLGVALQQVTPELAEGMHLPNAEGALIANVTEGGPADRAGIKQGDVILQFNGKPVPEMRILPRLVAEAPIGARVPVMVFRKGQTKTVDVQLGELTETAEKATQPGNGKVAPEKKTGSVTLGSLGLKVDRLTDAKKQQLGLAKDLDGVLVVGVDDSGPAAEKGLQKDDVIVEVDQHPVAAPADIEKRVQEADDNGFRVVTLLVNRSGTFNWVAVRIKKQQ
ncbi:MAG TPA: DegQ family serine endoprotease [Dongiaceae bacterium]|nr:DegQ family serine endoprotease [Dongiaceae bacterium]